MKYGSLNIPEARLDATLLRPFCCTRNNRMRPLPRALVHTSDGWFGPQGRIHNLSVEIVLSDFVEIPATIPGAIMYHPKPHILAYFQQRYAPLMSVPIDL